MSYTELVNTLKITIGECQTDVGMMEAKVLAKEWARAKSYTRAIRLKLVRIDAMLDTIDLIDEHRPPTTP